MSTFRYLSLMVVIGCATVITAFAVRQRQRPVVLATQADIPFDAPDSVRLASIGLAPGKQLLAYFFGGSRCSYCRSAEVKAAIAGLKDSLVRAHGTVFSTVLVVGIAINTDLNEGLGCLTSIGLDSFDEISTGGGWQNEEVIRWIRRAKTAEAAVPLVILTTRTMDARLTPLSVSYSADSVLSVLQGRTALLEWVATGTPLQGLPNEKPNGQKEDRKM